MHFYSGTVSFELRNQNDKHPNENSFIIYGNASAETIWLRYLSASKGDVSGAPKYLFYTSNYQLEKDNLLNKFQVRIAGGGVVRENDKKLVILRDGVYDLPKGHLEKGEIIEECAVREIEEETGVKAKINGLLIETFHTYIYKGNHIMKHTFWYDMISIKENQKLIPQKEEGIEKVEWLSSLEIKSKVWKNTYKSIKEVLNMYVD